MAAVSGRMSPRVSIGYPLTDTPRPRDPSVALTGATRRCFALLWLSRRGAMRLLGCVGVGVGECGSVGWVGWVGPLARAPFALACSDLPCGGASLAGPRAA